MTRLLTFATLQLQFFIIFSLKQVVYAGVSELVVEDSIARFAIVVRNVSDLVSFLECQLALLPSPDKCTAVINLIIHKLLDYRNLYQEKFAAVAFPRSLVDECPALCLQIWKHLDAVPYVIGKEPRQRTHADQGELATFAGWEEKLIDEQADSIARKCIRSACISLSVANPLIPTAGSDRTQVIRHWTCPTCSA